MLPAFCRDDVHCDLRYGIPSDNGYSLSVDWFPSYLRFILDMTALSVLYCLLGMNKVEVSY